MGRRTQSSKTYVNPDGTLTTRFFSGPIHYRDARGNWKEIENEFVATAGGPFEVKNGRNAFDVAFKPAAEEGYLRFGVGSAAFDFSLEGAGAAPGRHRGRSVSYDDVMPGVDLDYDLLPEGLKETLVLRGPNVPTRYRFVMTPASGVTAEAVERPDGSWDVYADAPTPSFFFAAPTVVESPGQQDPTEPTPAPSPSDPSPAPSPEAEPTATPSAEQAPDVTPDPTVSPSETAPSAAPSAGPPDGPPGKAGGAPATGEPPAKGETPAGGTPTGPKESTANASLEIRSLGSDRLAIEISVDPHWLHDPERQFPVLLDPTIQIPTSTEDASFYEGCPTCFPTVGTYLNLGTDNTGAWRDALRFDVSELPTTQITSAELRLWHDGACISGTVSCSTTGRTIDLHRLTKPWSPSGTTTSQLEYDAAVVDSYVLAAGASSVFAKWNVTQVVKDWVSGAQSSFGVLLKQSQETPGVGGGVHLHGRRSTDGAHRPQLDVTYADTPVTLQPVETVHSNGAELTWTPYTSATGGTFQKYEVHRSQSKSFTPDDATTLLATITDRNSTAFLDKTAAPNKSFTYRIVANEDFVSNARTVSTPTDGTAVKYVQETPGEQSQDTTLVYKSNDQYCFSAGRSTNVDVGTSAGFFLMRGLMRFGLDEIASGANIRSAKLWLTLRPGAAPTGSAVTVEARRVTRGWVQGTYPTSGCNGRGATWYTYDGANAWSSDGGDFAATVEDTVTVQTNADPGRYSWNVGSLVTQWASGAVPNFGILLKSADEALVSQRMAGFYSTDSVLPGLDQGQRPTLEVWYDDGSHSLGPSATLTQPIPGKQLSGTAETLAATVTDDGRVESVEFLVDGSVVGSDATAPYEVAWNTTTAANGDRAFTVRARDEVGNVTTSTPVTARVENSAPPTVSLTAPGTSPVSGEVTVAATASDDGMVDRVEFRVDGYPLAADGEAPYQASWDTLGASPATYNGTHEVSAVAYDNHGRSTTSTTTVTVANAPGSKYSGSLTSSSMPQEIVYDPPTCGADGASACPQTATAINVSYKNNSTQTWLASDVVLKYQWVSPSGAVLATGAEKALWGDTAPGAKVPPVRVNVDPPALDPGTDRAQLTLRVDLFEKSTGTWFASKGNAPLEAPVTVHKLKATDMLGLERYYHYTGTPLGAGMGHLVNLASGNSIVRWTPFSAPGRGLSTVLDLTYNSLEAASESPAGNNFSLSLSSLTRFGNPLDIHPNNADTIAGNANRMVRFTDGDGTTHEFVGKQATDGTVYWEEPAGVHLWLRTFSTTNPARKWALTRPDGVTFFYNADGFPTSVEDRNGNKLTFTLEAVDGKDHPGGPKYRITRVTDAAGATGSPNRSFDLDYYTKNDGVPSRVRGRIEKITDRNGSALVFHYYDDGNLLRLTQKGGVKADGSPLADRSFVFTYVHSSGTGPAISDPAARANPNPETSPQASRLFSVRDPRGAETTFTYLAPGNGQDKWMLASLTDRAGKTTSFTYGTDRTTTVTAPLSRVTKYTFDGEGKVTSVLDPLGRTSSITWSADRHVTRVEEPGGGATRFAYNANGYLTDRWDQLNRHTQLTYDNLAVRGENGSADARDATGYWKTGRGIEHMSELASVVDARGNDVEFDTDPRGNVTATRDEENFESRFAYDPANGNLTSVTDARSNVTQFLDYDANGFPQAIQDAEGNVTRMTYDADGLLRTVQLPRNSSKSRTRYTAMFFDYDSFHRMGRQSQPKSEHEVIWSGADYDANDNLILQRSPKDGLPELLTASGSKVALTYDAMDRLLLSDGPDAGQKMGYAYDDAGRLTTLTSPKGMATATVDDFATTYSYDALDRVVKTTRWTSAGSASKTKTVRYQHFCYSVRGDLVAQVAPRASLATVDCALATAGNVSFTTRFEYDLSHRLGVVRHPDNSNREFFYDPNGNLTTLVDELDKVSTFTYDRRNMVTKTERPFNANRKIVSRTFYDSVGNVVKKVSPRAFDLSDGTTFTHYVTEYVYDKANRLTRVDLPQAPGEANRGYVHRKYDADGNVIVSTLPSIHSSLAAVPAELRTDVDHFLNGWTKSVNDHANPETFYDYSAEGWQESRSLGTGKEETWTYFPDGTLHVHEDRDDQTVTYAYDANNNVLSIDENAGKTAAGKKGVEIFMSYGAFDELVEVKNRERGDGQDATAKFTVYTYDAHGNPLSRVDDGVRGADGVIRGRTHKFTYDARDRLSTHWDAGDNSGCGDDQLITNTYVLTGMQARKKISRTNGTCPASPTDAAWSPKQETVWGYLGSGDLQTLTTTTWNESGVPSVVEDHTVDYTETVGAKNVYVNGHRVKDTFILKKSDAMCETAPGCVAQFEYDARDKLVRHARNWAAATQYTLDHAGNVEFETRGNMTKDYEYRGTRLQRLAVTENAQTQTFDYIYNAEGTLGCVVLKSEPPATECPEVGSPKLVTEYDYDYLERLEKVREFAGQPAPQATTTYDHDVLDRLERETEKRGTRTKATDFTYVGVTGNVAKERIDNSDSANSAITDVTKTYSYDAFGTRVSMTNSPDVPGSNEGGPAGTFTYGYDVHGSVSQLIKANGETQATYGYLPYGSTDTALTKGELQGVDQLNPYRYSGKRLDTGSGTIDMGARRFGPDTGRFLQPDVFSGALSNLGLSVDPLSGNRYSLASGNPISFVEVDGHMLNKAAGGGAKPGPRPYPFQGGQPADPAEYHDSVVSARRVRETDMSLWSKFWGGLFDVTTGYEPEDHSDQIAYWSHRAGVDPRTVMAIMKVEGGTRQRYPFNGYTIDVGLMIAEETKLKRLLTGDDVSLGHGQLQKEWFVKVALEHPEVLGRDATFAEAGGEYDSLIVDSDLAIRAIVYRVKQLQSSIRGHAPQTLGYYEEQGRIAAAYKSGNAEGSAIGAVPESAEGYVPQFWDEFRGADQWFCQGEYFECSGY